MAGAASGRARPSGSSATTSRATRRPASIGARARKSQRLYVRETEWEAAQSVWLWRDASASMDYARRVSAGGDCRRSASAPSCCLLALAALLVRGGERVALLGQRHRRRSAAARCLDPPRAAARHRTPAPGLPPNRPLPRHGQLVLIGDFLSPLDASRHRDQRALPAPGVTGYLLQISIPPKRAALHRPHPLRRDRGARRDR